MKTLKFKTNINCSGCIKAITPFLDKAEGVRNWQVDTSSPDKILSVETYSADGTMIKKAVESAGFTAALIV